MNLTKWIGMGAFALVSGIAGYQLGLNERADPEISASIASSPQIGEREDAVLPITDTLQAVVSPSSQSPALSAREIFDTKSNIDRYKLLADYFEDLSTHNIEQFLADIEELPPSSRRTEVLSMLFTKWGEIDGPAAFAYAKSIKGLDRSRFLSAAATSWAKTDPTQAWETLMTATDNGKMTATWAGGVIMSIAENDLRKAVELAIDFRKDSRISYGSGYFTMGYGLVMIIESAERNGQFSQLHDIFIEESDPAELGQNLEALFQSWGKYEFENPLAIIEGMENRELSSSAMTGFLKGWAAADGNEAFRYAIENQDDATVAKALPDIAMTLLKGATADEIDEIISQFDSIEDKNSLSGGRFLTSLVRVNPEAGMQFANQMTDKKKRDQSIRTVAANWARSDLAGADEYARTIDNESSRKMAVTGIIGTHVSQQTDPQQILSLAEGFSDSKMTENVLSNIVANALSDRNQSKSQALIEELERTIPLRDDISAESKARLLDKLKK